MCVLPYELFLSCEKINAGIAFWGLFFQKGNAIFTGYFFCDLI